MTQSVNEGLPNPLHQFELKKLLPFEALGVDLSFTNASLFMVLVVCIVTFFMLAALRKPGLVPGRAQVICELGYDFVGSIVRDNAGEGGRPFFPFVFALFFFILLGNLLGMVPYAYTFTSQIIVTFVLAMMVFLLATMVGFIKHGVRYLSLFVPKGLPVLLYPLVVVIEIISYLSRPVTLAVRLFANMMAGHIMLKIFAGFSVLVGVKFGLGPAVFNMLLIGFEFMVAILQAYVFAILTCIYLSDALYLHQ